MSLLSSLILGFIQGVAEFLPISSSGHLAIAEQLLGMQGVSDIPEFFDVLLHLGTLVAVFAAYWAEIRELIVEFFSSIGDIAKGRKLTPLVPARRMILLVIVGTLPLFAVLPIKDFVEGLANNMFFVGGALIFTGCLLFMSDRVRRGRKSEKNASYIDALLVGIAQAIATCPGISRSGMTITAGCFTGFERSFAVRYSFIMSIPAILGANILSIKDAIGSIDVSAVPVYLAGMAVSAVVGYACIRLLKMIAASGRFGAFAYYCWGVGALTLILTVL